MPSITIQLPESIPVEEARLELAIALYRTGRLSQGEAAHLAGFSKPTFLELLASHGIPFSNIEAGDFEEELATWRSLESQTPPQSSS